MINPAKMFLKVNINHLLWVKWGENQVNLELLTSHSHIISRIQ